MEYVNKKKLLYLEYLHRENDIRHHRYDEEMEQYDYLKVGNPKAIEKSIEMFHSNLMGHVSHDPLRNMKYLFVASITLATRFAITGGMDEETAYNASDLYIQKMDTLTDIEAVQALHKDMFSFFTHYMGSIQKEKIFSKHIIMCIDYINYHLNEKITIKKLSDYVGLNHNYLSELFKKETGYTLLEYITNKRIETACNMLKYSQYSSSEIASILAFSSQSHFVQIFKKKKYMTPKQYRDTHYRNEFSEKE